MVLIIVKFIFSTGVWTYVHTIRRPEINLESPEIKTQITEREYKVLMFLRTQKIAELH